MERELMSGGAISGHSEIVLTLFRKFPETRVFHKTNRVTTQESPQVEQD